MGVPITTFSSFYPQLMDVTQQGGGNPSGAPPFGPPGLLNPPSILPGFPGMPQVTHTGICCNISLLIYYQWK